MVTYAKAKNLPISPQKMNLVLELIRNKDIEEAQRILDFTNKKAARLAKKTLSSAIANVEHNEDSSDKGLRVVEARADKAPTLKRWRPRAKGQADRILKRRTHLTIGVDEK